MPSNPALRTSCLGPDPSGPPRTGGCEGHDRKRPRSEPDKVTIQEGHEPVGPRSKRSRSSSRPRSRSRSRPRSGSGQQGVGPRRAPRKEIGRQGWHDTRATRPVRGKARTQGNRATRTKEQKNKRTKEHKDVRTSGRQHARTRRQNTTTTHDPRTERHSATTRRQNLQPRKYTKVCNMHPTVPHPTPRRHACPWRAALPGRRGTARGTVSWRAAFVLTACGFGASRASFSGRFGARWTIAGNFGARASSVLGGPATDARRNARTHVRTEVSNESAKRCPNAGRKDPFGRRPALARPSARAEGLMQSGVL